MLAFWLTCVVEAPWWVLGLPALSQRAQRPVSRQLAVVTAVVVNLVTHPTVWWLTADRALVTWVLAEIAAVAVEVALVGVVLRRAGAPGAWVSAALLGLGANATSALVGVLFF